MRHSAEEIRRDRLERLSWTGMTNAEKVGAAMSALVFSVRAADGTDVHRMEAARTTRGLRFTCTCSDGTEGRHCEHRVALFLGDASALVEVDESSVTSLMAMAKGSPLLQAVHMLTQAEAAMAEAQLDLDRAKRVIATVLQG